MALCDTDDPEDSLFHLCKVIALEDDKAVLLNYATFQPNIKTAKFGIMYQERSTHRYTTQKPETDQGRPGTRGIRPSRFNRNRRIRRPL